MYGRVSTQEVRTLHGPPDGGQGPEGRRRTVSSRRRAGRGGGVPGPSSRGRLCQEMLMTLSRSSFVTRNQPPFSRTDDPVSFQHLGVPLRSLLPYLLLYLFLSSSSFGGVRVGRGDPYSS